MPTVSPREIVRAGIIVIASTSFSVGLFLMLSVARWVQHDPLWYVMLNLMPVPIGILAVALHARRMLAAVRYAPPPIISGPFPDRPS
jgi:hypothetical protein